MKKSVLFIALLLVMTNFGQAHICEGNDPTINGVYISGECFNCGNNDGICPEDFGADCAEPDPDCTADLLDTSAPYWSLDGTTKLSNLFVSIDLNEGEDLYLIVPETGLANNVKVDLDLYEDDFWGDDFLGTVEATVNSSGVAKVKYEVTALEDVNNPDEGFENGQIKVYFKYYDENSAKWRQSFNLEVNLNIGQIGGIETCSEYTSEEDCEENTQRAAISEGAYLPYGWGDECLRKEKMVGCEWDSTSSKCSPAPSIIEYHPDNINYACWETATSCKYTESGNTECGSGDEFFKVSYASDQDGCNSWTTAPIPCPQELRVPFFGTYSFITTLSLISLIYVYLIFRKK